MGLPGLWAVGAVFGRGVRVGGRRRWPRSRRGRRRRRGRTGRIAASRRRYPARIVRGPGCGDGSSAWGEASSRMKKAPIVTDPARRLITGRLLKIMINDGFWTPLPPPSPPEIGFGDVTVTEG